MLDSTQVVSGIAVLLSFLAGYRYGVRNFEEQTVKPTTENATGNERVNVYFTTFQINCHCFR